MELALLRAMSCACDALPAHARGCISSKDVPKKNYFYSVLSKQGAQSSVRQAQTIKLAQR